MHLDTKTYIAGQPAIKVRDFLRKAEGNFWNTGYAGDYFKINENEAQALVEELAQKKYIAKNRIRNEECWTTTSDGIRFFQASATKGILRPNAEKLLEEFLKRVQQVNEDNYFLYRVMQVAVFGSYLQGEKDRINDIDLFVQLEPKNPDNDKHWQMNQERIEDAEKRGRRFSNFTERLIWSQTEVWAFLKNRSRALSLHSWGEHQEFIKDVPFEIIFTV